MHVIISMHYIFPVYGNEICLARGKRHNNGGDALIVVEELPFQIVEIV